MPRTGLRAREAMPVLKFLAVMSRMEVPVVSEPVPAVVGTAMGRLCQLARNDCCLASEQLTGNEREKLLLDWQAFANGCVYKIHQVGFPIYRKPRSPRVNASPPDGKKW